MNTDEMPGAYYIISNIIYARENAIKAVNTELISTYWKIGEHLHYDANKEIMGDEYFDCVAEEIQKEFLEIKGFSASDLQLMLQFYETYYEDKGGSALVTKISWENNLLIMEMCSDNREREFYIKSCIDYNYSKAQLRRQIKKNYYDRYMKSKNLLLPFGVEKIAKHPFADTSAINFLRLIKKRNNN